MSTQKLVSGLFVAVAMSTSFLSPAVASAHESWHYQHKPNIVEKEVEINTATGEFSTLIAAVSCTNLIDRLQKEHRKFTVFAPTDAAFAKAGLNKDNVCTAFDKHTLTDILEYHVARRAIGSSEVLSRRKLFMLNGEKARIKGTTIDGQNIVQTDVKVSNGIIHVIDGVMLP